MEKYINQFLLKFSPIFMVMRIFRRFFSSLGPPFTHRLYPLIMGKEVGVYFASQDGLGTIKAFTPSLGETVVDVGAHVGVWTVLASSQVGNRGKVIAIEPHPQNYTILLGNIIVNDLKNVMPINVALSDHEGTVRLYVGKRSAWHSMVYDERSQFLQSPNSFVEVPCTTLDKLLPRLNVGSVNWIKIDVEGAEQYVLEGAKGVLRKSPQVKLILEIHKEHRKVLSFLKKLGLSQKTLNIQEDSRQHVYASYQDN